MGSIFLDAAHIWAGTFLKPMDSEKTHGEKIQVCCIGPAGENLLSSPVFSRMGRMAGRLPGAV